jgi:hypothetical protein
MVASGLPLRGRIDFSCYLDPGAGAFSDVLQRALDDADVTLPSLGAVKSYGAVETYHFLDAGHAPGDWAGFGGERRAEFADAARHVLDVTQWRGYRGGCCLSVCD